ncbi:hypothetical protein Pmani_018857 [Petrolisthes manimaculis]|uniref:Uncharacterized protein n=1 Tax=Petrolisthes manimaculis TaxID=1843537 RepID=A0AAE1PLM3_9EUCA|nr:hypothetical protein Pmani_018857 [Petrolisthes manimaculis]
MFPVRWSLGKTAGYRSTRFTPTPSTLIIGPPHCVKTSLLVQAAVTEAAGDGQVLYIAPKKLLHLPVSVHGMMPPTPRTMQGIKFLYAQETKELISYLASLHMIPAGDRPSLIVIDDLHVYSLSSNCGDTATQMMNVARILSLAQESAEFCSSTTDTSVGRQCCLLAAWTQDNSSYIKPKELQELATSFCHHVWSVHPKCKTASSEKREYTMVEEENGNLCTISFSSRHDSLPTEHLLLHQVSLQSLMEASRTEDCSVTICNTKQEDNSDRKSS